MGNEDRQHVGRCAVRIQRSFSHGRYGPTKSGRSRTVELSGRLSSALSGGCPDLFGENAPMFSTSVGRPIDSHNFRRRIFQPLVREAFGEGRPLVPHSMRHTFATLHLAAGTPIKWLQAQGGWASAKVLLDTYGHFLPSETYGHADALTGTEHSTETAQNLTARGRSSVGSADPMRKAIRTGRVPGGRAPTRTGDPLLVRQVL